MNGKKIGKYLDLISCSGYPHYMKKTACAILEKISRADRSQAGEYEFSWRIRKGTVDRTLRLVNFDNVSHRKASSYRQRVKAVRDIVLEYPGYAYLEPWFNRLEKSGTRMPLYFGFDISDSQLVFKFYFNSGEMQGPARKRMAYTAVLKGLGLALPAGKRDFPLVGIDAHPDGQVFLKVYYLFGIPECKRFGLKGLSACERAVLDFVGPYNRNAFIVFAQRYLDGKPGSRKIEVGIQKGMREDVFLRGLLQAAFPGQVRLAECMHAINQYTGAHVNVVIVEKDMLTVYNRIHGQVLRHAAH